MKRYLVFYADAYYPLGGIDDFIGDYDTIEEAIKVVQETHRKNIKDDVNWDYALANILDIQTSKVVFNTKNEINLVMS